MLRTSHAQCSNVDFRFVNKCLKKKKLLKHRTLTSAIMWAHYPFQSKTFIKIFGILSLLCTWIDSLAYFLDESRLITRCTIQFGNWLSSLLNWKKKENIYLMTEQRQIFYASTLQFALWKCSQLIAVWTIYKQQSFIDRFIIRCCTQCVI